MGRPKKQEAPAAVLEVFDSDEETDRLVSRFRSLGPCVAHSRNKSVWIAESTESPGYFFIQKTMGSEVSFLSRPMRLSVLRYTLQRDMGLNVARLDFQPCRGLLLDQLTGRITGDSTVTGFVYFLQSSFGGPIKIGFATDLDRRIRDLQTAHHTVLRVLAAIPGTRGMEHWIQGSLKKQRIRGEWFEDGWELQTIMRELQGRERSASVE